MRWLLALVLASCSSSEAAEPVPSGDASSETPSETPSETGVDVATDAVACALAKPFSTKNAPCNACAEARCCEAINACLADKRCDDDYVNCSLACALLPEDAGDASAEMARCLDDCAAMHPEGKTLYDAAFGCTDAKCAAECG